MQTKLLPIMSMRAALLSRCNQRFFKRHQQTITNSSLAAQDFYFSGDLADYDGLTIFDLNNDVLYKSLHDTYNLSYNPNNSQCINYGLVIDLARALRTDIQSGLLNTEGQIIVPSIIEQSQILQTVHNDDDSGTPVQALSRMRKQTRALFLVQYHNIRKK